MKHQNDHIKFPSGNTVEFCRKKAKKLAKEKGIKLAQALDIMAELNGISGGWHNAMQQLNNKLQPSAVISPKLPEKLEKLFEKIGAAIPKQPDHVEQGAVSQINHQATTAPAPSDRYTRGFLT
ncbi:hypothetical protein ACK3ZS_20220, partial [Aeromonas caviae]